MVLASEATLSAADLGFSISHEGGDQSVLGKVEFGDERTVGRATVGDLELQDFSVAVQEGRHGGDATTDETQNTVGGCCTRRKGNIDARTAQQTEECKAMQHSYGLGGAVRLRETTGKDVGVVFAGERNDHLVTTDIGFVEQVVVGDIALEDKTILELFGKFAGPFGFRSTTTTWTPRLVRLFARISAVRPPPSSITRFGVCFARPSNSITSRRARRFATIRTWSPASSR